MVYLFDIDGVLIHYSDYFSSTLSTTKYNNPKKNIDDFYKSQINRECDKNKKNILQEIQPYLQKMNWNGDVESYLQLQWNYEKGFIETDLLQKIRLLKSAGHKVFIASNQNKYRRDFLVSAMHLPEYFNHCFFSCDIGYVKSEKEYWDYIQNYLRENKMESEHTLFFDDLIENINMAKSLGINSIQISSKNEITDYLENEIRKMA